MNSYLTGKTRNFRHTILLAEDDRDDQELLKDAFEEVDPSCSLHIVENGKSVLDYLNNAPDDQLPCLIILDYNMPELNGGQVLQKLLDKPRFRTIPKVVLSTSGNTKYVKEAMDKGAHAYRVKPYDFSRLVAIAKEMLDLCNKAA
ncbi:MAG TPA: response regulator [Chitinophagaceae bacterium]|jgi:CheY-like chemotaxis protein|nr:response regulator [Chitinophagaceae bacterium]